MTIKQWLQEKRAEDRQSQRLIGILNTYGYTRFNPSYFESFEDYVHCKGRTSKLETVKVINGMGDVEILRPDVTLSILKTITGLGPLEKVKLTYDTRVFKLAAEGIAESRQIGAEYFGEMSIDCDLEVMGLAVKCLKDTDAVLVIGHTKFITGLLKATGLSPDKQERLLTAMYHKQQKETIELLRTSKVSEEVIEKFKQVMDPLQQDLTCYRKGYLNSEMRIALHDMEYIMKMLPEPFQVDLGMVSRFDYYDGLIFKGYMPKWNAPVLRGGRYDKLTALYGASFPAVGFSIAFDAYMKGVSND